MPGMQGDRISAGQAAKRAGPQDLSATVREVRRQGMGRGHQLTARRYFDNHHHNAVARAAAKAADINNAGMQPFTNSRVAGLVILNISVAYNPSEDRLPLFPGYPAALFPSHVSDCSAIHLLALASLEKPSIVSTCPLDQVASTIHPIAGGVFLREVKVGRGSLISHYSKNLLRNITRIVPIIHRASVFVFPRPVPLALRIELWRVIVDALAKPKRHGAHYLQMPLPKSIRGRLGAQDRELLGVCRDRPSGARKASPL
jgi:hypothetical protein